MKESSPLYQIIVEREAVAFAHDEVMKAKYGWSADGYNNWYDENGYREYPLPYSERYFQRFVELFFRSSDATSIVADLEAAFVGDEADNFYIEALLARAERFGVFTPDSLLIFNCDDENVLTIHYGPDREPDPEHLASAQYTVSIIYGSKANKSHRKIIRSWLAMRARQLATKQAAEIPSEMPEGSALPLDLSKVPTLEDLCIGSDSKRQQEVAQIIDTIWDEAKAKVSNETKLPTACVAVYKLAEWLGMTKKEITTREWKAALTARYGLSISEGLGKYRVNNPTSKVFRDAVSDSYAFVRRSYPRWAKAKDLPDIYR